MPSSPALDCAVGERALKKPLIRDPLLEILWKRGLIHEQTYLDHLTKYGLEVVKIEGVEVTDAAVAKTVAAMRNSVQAVPASELAEAIATAGPRQAAFDRCLAAQGGRNNC